MKSPFETPKSKYRAVPVVVDGIRFDSKAEARYYAELKLRERAGEVYEVELQPRFQFVHNGQLIGTYRADFKFWSDATKRTHVVDVKGVQTEAFKIKRKLMRAFHGIDVEVVR